MGGTKVSAQLTLAVPKSLTPLPCAVIWPCDIQACRDEDEVLQVENYILDDVSVSPSDIFPGLNPLAL